MAAAGALLRGALGPAALAAMDPAVLEYAEQILEDPDLDLGAGGDGLFEAVGELLLEACAGTAGEAEVRAACSEVAGALAAGTGSGAGLPASRLLAEGVTIGEQADAVAEDFAALGQRAGPRGGGRRGR